MEGGAGLAAGVGAGSGSSEYLGLGRSGARGLVGAAIGVAVPIGLTAAASVSDDIVGTGMEFDGGMTSDWAVSLGASGLTHNDSPVAELT